MTKIKHKGLKILVVKSYHKGNTVVWEEACLLRRFGHHVEVLIPAQSEVSEFLEACGISVHIINIRSSLVTSNIIKKRCLDVIAIFKLRTLFKKFNVVHLNLQRARILGRLANIFRRGPIIVSTIRGQDLDKFWLWLLERLTNRLDNRTVAISKDVKRYLVEKGLPASRISVIYNGVDLDAIDSVPYTPDFLHSLIGLPSDTPFVGMIARFYPHIKGHDVFIRSAYYLHQKFSDIRFIIIGGSPFGDDTYLRELKALVNQLELQNIIYFVGELHHKDIPRVLDSLKVLVVPSLIREGFGLVITEAMARKVPVIGSDIGGITEVIKNGKTGLLVKPGSSMELTKALSFILLNPRKAKKMGEAGRKRVEEKFTSEIMAKNYELLYYDLLERNNK